MSQSTTTAHLTTDRTRPAPAGPSDMGKFLDEVHALIDSPLSEEEAARFAVELTGGRW